SPALTQEGTILGTFQYMAPEQLEGKEADARTDIFALGCVLYEMVTGKRAFSGATQASLISAILRDDPQPISQVQPMSPAALDRIVKTCLSKDPEERWQSAADVKRELRWIAEGSTVAAIPSAAPRPAMRRELWWPAAAGLLLLATLFLGNEVRRLRASDKPRATHSFLIPPEKTEFRLTGDDAAHVVLSPDGGRVAFGAGGKLWVQSLRTGSVAPLASSEGARSPFWSPDSRFIAFFSEGKLRSTEASGGPVQTICNAPNPRGGAWGKTGVIVFTPDIRTGLFRVASSGGTPEPLTRPDVKQHTTHRWPYFLPDGKHVVYVAANHASPRSEQSGVYVVSIDGKEDRRVFQSYGSAQYASGWLLSVRDSDLMAQRFDADTLALSGQPVRVADNVNFDAGTWRGSFTVSENGVLAYHVAQTGVGGQLTWLDSAGRSLGTVGDRSEAYATRLSPDGRRASVIVGDPNNDIWVYELDRGVRTRQTTGAQVTPSPVWSPDGSEILFCSQRGLGEFVLSSMAADGAGEHRVFHRSKVRIEPTDWSRDGRYILCDKGNIGATDVWVYPIAEPDKAFPLVQSSFLELGGQFSPDGRWVAYRSVESGRHEIYVTPFPRGGARWQVSAGGATQPRWSRDGNTLYFVSADNQLMAATVDGRGPRFEVKETKPLFRVNLFIGPRLGIPGFDVAPNGRFLVSSAGEVGAPRVALVVNWTAGLPE
ncbi:MAG TPA: protein kinase, partial [Thermoanaerobaculia bacterium]|nr:protein kinase [Thermoanaerobaculia bacterium]